MANEVRPTTEASLEETPAAPAPDSGAARGASSRPSWRGALLALAVVSAAFAFRAIAGFEPEARGDLEGVEGFFFAPSGSSPGLVFATTAWLFSRRWRRLRAAVGDPPRPLAGALLLLPAAALCVWAHYVTAPVLLIPALTLLLLGGSLAIAGGRAFRAMRFPALFLLFAVPIPTIVVNQIIFPMQLATAELTTWLLNQVGLEAVSIGDRILHAGAVFQVIESCSGLRTTETIFMSSFLYIELFRRSRTRSILLVASAPAIGLLCNQVRVLSIVLNPYSRFSAVHTAQGLVMLVAGVLLLAVADWVLGKLLRDRDPGPLRWKVRRTPPPLPAAPVVALALLGLALAASTAWLPPWKPGLSQLPQLSSLPPKHDGWQAEGLKLDDTYLGSIQFSEWVHRRYTRGEDEVEILLGGDRRLSASVNMLSTKVASPGSGWEIVDQFPTALGSEGLVVTTSVAATPGERRLVQHWYVGVDSLPEEIARSLLALDRGPWRRPGRAVVVRVSTRIEPRTSGRSGAAQRLESFLTSFQTSLAELTTQPLDL